MTRTTPRLAQWKARLEEWRRRRANRRRRWAVFRYNVLHRFPFLTWPFKLAGAALILAGVGIAGLLVSIEMGAFGKLPDRDSLSGITNYVATEVLAADSSVLGRYYFENRSNVRYRDISPAFIQALIATEDARYFQHDGVDLRSWGRVFVKTVVLKDRSSGGGSTLSQQLAKNLYPREEYPYASLVINKLREVFIARRLELLYTKEELLELYLNTVPFSENTYGIKTAAQRFFNTTPRNLTAEQSAVLVAMLKAPSTYNPVRHPELSVERRNLVLRQMVSHGYLTPALADSLLGEPLCLEYYPLDHNHGAATYFREHLRLEVRHLLRDLRKENGMAYNLYTDGLKIYTTIDANLQEYAETAVSKHMRQLQRSFDQHLQGDTPWELDTVLILARRHAERYRLLKQRGVAESTIDSIFEQPVDMTVFSWDGGQKRVRISPMDSIKYYLGFLNAGLLAMEPATGRIRVWVGGTDYRFFKYDHVKARRQVGSTFKPLVYATALQQGIDPCSYTANALRTYGQFENWTPRNATERYGGYYSMTGGLLNSVNTVTVSLAMRARPHNVARLAGELGITGEILPVPAIALGAVDASLLDMVTVYGAFANRGRRPEPYYIRRIETAGGRVLIDMEAGRDTCAWQRPLYVDQADMINQMLRAAVDRGTGQRLRWRYKFSNELAGKTGTSQNHSDGWFMGYNPALVTGVWVGAESPAVRFRNLTLGQGANTALPLFAEFFSRLKADARYRTYTGATFPKPSPRVQEAMACADVKWPDAAATPPAAPATVVQVQAAAAPARAAAPAENLPPRDDPDN